MPIEAWTPDSSITVSLMIVDNGLAVSGNVTGWFDRITLTHELNDVIFANGFQ